MTHEGFKRKLTANFSADVKGYSRCITGSAYDQVQNKLGLQYEFGPKNMMANCRTSSICKIKLPNRLLRRFSRRFN
jgi:hypothetical protein